ncbi:MAG: hypothetical protein KF846_11530 [Cyclobacteriaceae bacterium]|nr:hypothetical protein [Cyclobacteriaceae bacterium]
MKKLECPSCAMNIDAKSKTCPICGYEFPKANKLNQWIVILLVVLFLFYIVSGIF